VTAIAAPPRPSSGAAVEPLAEELKSLVEEKGVDWDKTGLKYLSNEARVSQRCDLLCEPVQVHWPVAAVALACIAAVAPDYVLQSAAAADSGRLWGTGCGLLRFRRSASGHSALSAFCPRHKKQAAMGSAFGCGRGLDAVMP
jgi:hypothetical protein